MLWWRMMAVHEFKRSAAARPSHSWSRSSGSRGPAAAPESREIDPHAMSARRADHGSSENRRNPPSYAGIVTLLRGGNSDLADVTWI